MQTQLTKEQVESLVTQIDLLMAMYPAENEIAIDKATRNHLDMLRGWSTSLSNEKDPDDVNSVPSVLSLQLYLKLDDARTNETIQLNVELPTQPSTHEPQLKTRLSQPTWMTKAQTTMVNTSIPSDQTDDILSVIDYFRDSAALHLSNATISSPITSIEPPPSNDLPLVRVWFYFPSLSTRSKRNDLVNFASTYHLTGFVLAGKPGLLCLEGQSTDIDAYMRYIKTESWGDIPAHHKKVSERYREVEVERRFEGMQEITDEAFMGGKRGERGNRSDMGMLEGWLKEKGVEGVLGKVLI